MKRFFLLVALTLPVFAQSQDLGERAITLWNTGDDIICQTQIWDLATDTDDAAHIYAASNDGLCVYNGTTWEYLQPPGNPIIRALKYDKGSGRLYSAGVNGFGFWLPDGFGSFIYTPLYINSEFRSFSLDFWRIALYRQKVLFQSQKKIFVFDTETASVDTVSASAEFRYLYEADGRIWCQDGQTLLRFTPAFECDSICSVSGRIINLLSHNKGIVAAIERKGLVLLRPDGKEESLNPDADKLLSEAKITCCKLSPSGDFLVGTTKSGLFVLDNDGKIKKNYPLNNNAVLCVSVDNSGNLWTGFNNGAAEIDNSSTDRYIFNDRLGQVHGFSKLGENGVLVGTNKGVFLRKGGKDFTAIESLSGPAWGFYTIGRTVYVLHDQGLFLLSADAKPSSIFSNHGIFKLCPLSEQEGVYVAGSYSGLDIFHLDKQGVLRYQHSVEGYRGFTRNIDVDEFGTIWVSVAGDGFVSLRLDESFNRVVSKKDFKTAESSEQVFSANIDGQLVLISSADAYRPCENGGLRRTEEFDELVHLCGNGVRSIFQEGHRFWYVGASGAGCVERNGSSLELTTGILDKAHASRSGSGFSVIDGNVLLGFRNGIGICSGLRPKPGTLQVLSAVAVGAKETLRHKLTDDVFTVPADMNTVLIALFGLSADKRLEYRISSVSDKWSSIQIGNYLQLNSLQSGTHTVEMKIPGSESICRLVVRVERPWYLSTLALILYFLVVAGSIFATFQIVQYKNSEKQKQLRKEVEYLQMKNDLLEKERKLATHALVGVQADDELERYFNEIYNGFTDRLKRYYPALSKTDLKMCIFVKMNLSGKEIANRMNISLKAVEVAKYRLRKKLFLPPGETLANFISGFEARH